MIQITLATSARRTARIAFKTRTVSYKGKVSAFSACFPFITLNARFGDEPIGATLSERFDSASDMLDRLGRRVCTRCGGVGESCRVRNCIVLKSRLPGLRRSGGALRLARPNEFTFAEATTGEAWRDVSFRRTHAFACVAGAECCAADLIWINMSSLVTPKIRNCKLSE